MEKYAQLTGNQEMLQLNQIRLRRWNSSKTLIKALQLTRRPQKSQLSQRNQRIQKLNQLILLNSL